MKLFVVTRVDGKKIYINPELVCAIYPSIILDNTTVIKFPGRDDNCVLVLESADSIAKLIGEDGQDG